MAIRSTYTGLENAYEGCVLDWWEHNGAWDSDWYAVVWDDEKQSVEIVEYMTTRGYCSGTAEIDATEDTLRKVYRHYKSIAKDWFSNYNIEQAKKIRKGDTVKIVKGRKVKKGTVAPVFWSGTRYNPYSRIDEERIGIEVDGERVFIAAENAEVVGWENRIITGKKRKEAIRKRTVNMMPAHYRKSFSHRKGMAV